MDSNNKKKFSPVELKDALLHIKRLIFGARAVFDAEGNLQESIEETAVVYENDEERSIVEELNKEIKHLRGLIYRDELTGLLNRRGIQDEFGGLFKEALFSKEHPDVRKGVIISDFSVIFVDADNFKSINDAYGHHEGDRVLAEIAKVLSEHVRGIDAVGRLGGEEFVLGLLGASEDDAYAKAHEVRTLITKNVNVSPERTMTASIGVASLRHSNASSLDELIACADRAMYEAKTHRGKDTVVKYSELQS